MRQCQSIGFMDINWSTHRDKQIIIINEFPENTSIRDGRKFGSQVNPLCTRRRVSMLPR